VSAARDVPLPDAALSRVAQCIAAEPELARALARIDDDAAFADALCAAARERGILLDTAALASGARGRFGRHGAVLEHWPAQARRGWLPCSCEPGMQGLELVWINGELNRAAPFYEFTLTALRGRPLNRLFAVRTPITAHFVADLEAAALPIGLIFHMSRCGSTLLGQALKVWPGQRVVGEPGPLDSALMFALTAGDAQFLAPRAVLAALAQPGADATRATIKLDAWHVLAFAPLHACAPQAPWIFVYRDPVEVLVSHRRQPGRHTVPGMLPPGWLDAVFSVDGDDALAEYAARVLGAICRQMLPHVDAAHLLNYAELPEALAARVPRAFGLDPAEVEAAQFAAALRVHAKRPHRAFEDDRDTKRAEAGPLERSLAERYIVPHYSALERIRTGGNRR